MLTQIGQHSLNMLFELLSSLTEDENIINDHSCNPRQLMPWIQAAISNEFGQVEKLFTTAWKVAGAFQTGEP